MAFAHFVPLLVFDGSFSRAWRFPRLVVFVFYFSRLWNWLRQSARLCSTETCTLRGKTVVYLVAYVCFDWSDVNSYSVVCYCCVVIVNFVVVYFRVLEIGNTTKRRCSRPCTSSTVQVRMNTTGLIL